ncbi:MAG: uroporphyrinogen decarboxylase family protein [Firmicutes bacterium]|nr:uroporphyrinogen decarboxylase family protein [Bacillota bacterium]
MTERERFIKTLKREKVPGQVPTFELVFYLTMESLGKVHPSHRSFAQWGQMSRAEKALQIEDQARIYVDTARKYGHSAIFAHPNPWDFDSTERLLAKIRELSGDDYFVMLHGDTTFGIPDGTHMTDFSARLYEDPEGIVADQEANVKGMFDFSEKINKSGRLLDGYALCSDYCFNTNPYYSPAIFADLIAPALKKTLDGYRQMGFYTIKHTDGNIMPIADMLVECGPDALHSLDPQGGVDLKVMSEKYGGRVALCGNVNCGLLQTGTDEEAAADVKRSLRDGMARGAGYVFCTSNCAYTGLPLSRYEMMIELWKEYGKYPAQ